MKRAGPQWVRTGSRHDADGFAHVCTLRPDWREVFRETLELIHRVYQDFGVEVDYYRLSLRDPDNKEKYFDDDNMWNQAEEMLRRALKKNNIEYIEAKGEAAFYGPKLDIQIKTAMGHWYHAINDSTRLPPFPNALTSSMWTSKADGPARWSFTAGLSVHTNGLWRIWLRLHAGQRGFPWTPTSQEWLCKSI